jgi:23S rRNA (uridine2552-2'-O)-methyltransferase
MATQAWFREMVDTVKAEIGAFRRADGLREVFDADRAHLIGTSGAITSLAGLHLDLPRYERSRVDGIWMTRAECEAAANRLLALSARQRAEQPCIGPDRADLVLAGAAILQAVQELWPCSRVRVADRGLREGILLSLMSDRGGRRRRRRSGGRPMSDDPPPRKRMVKPPTGGTEAGRVVPERLKTAWKRTPSQQAWLSRQINDPFAAKARAHGYRSRAAYKLTEIDDKLRLLRPGARVVDLGAAPGGWTQVALERGVTNIVGVDLLPVDPLPPATILEMDFTDPACGPELIRLLGGPPDFVMSDIAPNTVGHRQTDHLRIVGLIEAAADFAVEVLKPGGAFVAKAFQGGETAEVIATLKRHFASVKTVKPKASRSDSSELYLVATGFRGR